MWRDSSARRDSRHTYMMTYGWVTDNYLHERESRLAIYLWRESHSSGEPRLSPHIYDDVTHICVARVSCDMTHVAQFVRHDSFIRGTWLIYVWRDICHACRVWICATWLIYMWDMTHICVARYMPHKSSVARRDSSIYATWLICMCDTTHPYLWRDSSIRVRWHICIYDVIHSYVRHDSVICVTWLISSSCLSPTHLWLIHVYVTWLIHMCDMIQCNTVCRSAS